MTVPIQLQTRTGIPTGCRHHDAVGQFAIDNELFRPKVLELDGVSTRLGSCADTVEGNVQVTVMIYAHFGNDETGLVRAYRPGTDAQGRAGITE